MKFWEAKKKIRKSYRDQQISAHNQARIQFGLVEVGGANDNLNLHVSFKLKRFEEFIFVIG